MYKLTDEALAKKKKVLLESMKDFAAFCDGHGLVYFIAYGTALGAARHGGFIPWDDDIDISMPIKDYGKFQKTWDKTELGEKYTLQYKKIAPYMPLMFTKIRRNGTSDIEGEFWYLPMHWGISIDIIPFFNAPRTKIMKKIHRKLMAKSIGCCEFSMYHPDAPELKKKYKNLMSRFLFGSVRFISFFCRSSGEFLYPYSRTPFRPRDEFYPVTKMKFEDLELCAPAKVDQYLTTCYGDYMTPPPEDKRYGHPTAIVDADKDFKDLIAEMVASGELKR